MNIKSKQFRAVLAVNLLALGLAACSSSPAPWSRPDTSPWTDKRAAEASTVPDDEIVVQEPVIYEPAPVVYEPDPVVYEPVIDVPPPAGVEARSVVSDINNEQRIMSLPGNHYAVQVYASTTLESMDKFKNQNMLDDLLTVKTDRNGKTMYVLVDVHETRGSAQLAAAELERKIGSKPWVRSVAGLQKVVQQ
ncbi:MAG: hypothetical protein WBN96_14400 [Gammaproteobacteria bacterium]